MVSVQANEQSNNKISTDLKEKLKSNALLQTLEVGNHLNGVVFHLLPEPDSLTHRLEILFKLNDEEYKIEVPVGRLESFDLYKDELIQSLCWAMGEKVALNLFSRLRNNGCNLV